MLQHTTQPVNRDIIFSPLHNPPNKRWSYTEVLYYSSNRNASHTISNVIIFFQNHSFILVSEISVIMVMSINLTYDENFIEITML